MSDTCMTIELTIVYQNTAAEMRERYPDEYKEFIAADPDADDDDWLQDCFDAGGVGAFDEVERDVDAWITAI